LISSSSYLLYLNTRSNLYSYHNLLILFILFHQYFIGCLKKNDQIFNCFLKLFNLIFIIIFLFLKYFNVINFSSKQEFQILFKAISFSFKVFSFFIYIALVFLSIFLTTITLFPFIYLFLFEFLYDYQNYLCFLAFSVNTICQKSQCEMFSCYL